MKHIIKRDTDTGYPWRSRAAGWVMHRQDATRFDSQDLQSELLNASMVAFNNGGKVTSEPANDTHGAAHGGDDGKGVA